MNTRKFHISNHYLERPVCTFKSSSHIDKRQTRTNQKASLQFLLKMFAKIKSRGKIHLCSVQQQKSLTLISNTFLMFILSRNAYVRSLLYLCTWSTKRSHIPGKYVDWLLCYFPMFIFHTLSACAELIIYSLTFGTYPGYPRLGYNTDNGKSHNLYIYIYDVEYIKYVLNKMITICSIPFSFFM